MRSTGVEGADELAATEPRLSSMVALSAVLHLVLLAGGLIFSDLMGERRSGPLAYTVELVSVQEIGGGLPREPRRQASQPSPPPTPEPKAVKAAPEQKPQPAPAPEPEAERRTEKEKPPADTGPGKVVSKTAPRQVAKTRSQPTEKRRAQPAKRAASASRRSQTAGMSQAEREKKIAAAIARVRRRVGGGGTVTGSIGGSGGGIVKGVQFLIYYNRMLARIKESWAWAGSRSGLEATVRFSVLDSGRITSLRIVHSSGDASYDASVLRAISAADPLPPPPPRYRKEFRDVELTFRPREPAAAG